MKYCSRLVLKSFRKNDIHIISEFISKLKIKVLKSLIVNLFFTKIKIISKISLSLFLNQDILLNPHKRYILDILNLNYFYSDIYYNSLNFNYVINKFNQNAGLFYNSIYDLYILSFILEYISGIKVKSFSHMPKKRKHFTVLKSPHTDKKSREQFALVSYRKSTDDEFDILYNIIKYTKFLKYGSCQLIYNKLTKIY